VDTLLFLGAVVFALLVIGGRLESSTPPAWLFTADVIAGAVGCAGLWLRRRWPVGLALVLVAFSTFSETVSGAMVIGMLTVAIHRPPRTTAAVFALSVVAALVYVVVRPEPGIPALLLFVIGLVVQSAAVGWGLFIHFRRQLVLSLRDRANRAETEAQLRAEQAQQRARDEIAREMHDVLGHRLSLLSVHAGALEFRPGAPGRGGRPRRQGDQGERPPGAPGPARGHRGPARARRGAAPADPRRRPAARRRVGPGRDAVTRRLIDRVAGSGHDRRARARERLALLNDREREVAVAVGQGRSNAEIGSVLYLSVPTVKTHVSSILTKLDLNNRVQIALLAHDAGLLDDPE
jgi:DNA-binding CsgD family transcriptional regulator